MVRFTWSVYLIENWTGTMWIFSFVLAFFCSFGVHVMWVYVLCIYTCICVPIPVKPRGQRQGSFSVVSNLFFWDRVFLWTSISLTRPDRLIRSPQRLWDYSGMMLRLGLLYGVRHACKASSLVTEPPFQLSLFFEQAPEMRVLWWTHFNFSFSSSRLSPQLC